MTDIYSELPLWVNVLIFLQQYWYAIMPTILIGGSIGLLRMFTMPLITRTPQELIIMFRPNNYKVIKVVARDLPYFVYKKGLYWFSDPLQLGDNLLHIYFEGVNQPITRLLRFDTKEAEILAQREFTKQTKGHTALLPVAMRVFATNWLLILKEQDDGKGNKSYFVELKTNKEANAKGRRQYRGGFFKRIGLYVTKAVPVESESASANGVLESITIQTVLERVGGIVKGTNFSSAYALKVLKNVKKLERDWYMMLTGAFDMRIIIVLMVVMLVIGAIFIFFKPGDISSLGPPPPEVAKQLAHTTGH